MKEAKKVLITLRGETCGVTQNDYTHKEPYLFTLCTRINVLQSEVTAPQPLQCLRDFYASIPVARN